MLAWLSAIRADGAKGHRLPERLLCNRQQWARKDPGARKINHLYSAEEKHWWQQCELKASVSNEGRINVLLWYCLVGAYVGLSLGVVGSPGVKWLRVVWGRRSPSSWHPLVAGGSASEQARLVKWSKFSRVSKDLAGSDRRFSL